MPALRSSARTCPRCRRSDSRRRPRSRTSRASLRRKRSASSSSPRSVRRRRPADLRAAERTRKWPMSITSPHSRSSIGSPSSTRDDAPSGATHIPAASQSFRRASSPRPWGNSRPGSRWHISAFAADRLRRSPTRRAFTPTSPLATRSCSPSISRAATSDAVAYSRPRRRRRQRVVIELIDCLGPMLPVEDFDSPEALAARARAASRRAARSQARSAASRRRASSVTACEAGHSARATLHVPEIRAVLRRSFSAPARLSRDAAARRADRSRDAARARGDALAGRQETHARADDPRENALVHAARRRARDRMRSSRRPAPTPRRSGSQRASTGRPPPPRASTSCASEDAR